MDKKQVHIVSHTHWDREWYLTFEQFRIRLVTLVDHLLDILHTQREYKHFMLDGQTIVLEDYLEIEPENENRLREYIQKGRILIGPWYILPDEFLVSGESLIRNLLLGERMCKKFGGKMNVGYLPDSFGHIAQMPQILKGFGIESAIIWRGVGNEVKTTEFIWEAPDGSDVLTVHMPLGYCTAGALPSNVETCRRRIRSIVDTLTPLATTDVIVLMNGCDHLEPQPDLPTILQSLNAEMEDISLIHSTLPRCFKEIEEKCATLPRFRKEWRSGERAVLLGGTLSTRMYLKQAIYRTEDLLEKWVEPFSSFAWLRGNSYPSEVIWQAWKNLLKNQPHDSICGCSLDEVHEEGMTRFAKAGQIGEELCNQALSFLTEDVDTSGERLALVIFNPLPHRRTEVADVALDLDEELLRDVDWETATLKSFEGEISLEHFPTEVKVYDSEGKIVSSSLNKVEKAEKMKLSPYNLPRVYLANRCHISILAQDIPGLGYRVYFLDSSSTEKTKILEKPVQLLLENEYFKLTPTDDGSLSILDKKTETLYRQANTFLDGGDAGDEYTYSPPLKDRIITSASKKARISWQEHTSVRSTLKIEISLNLPVALTEDRKERCKDTIECPVTSYVSISRAVRRVDIRTEVENRARDHRLRVLFPSGIEADYSHSEGHFHVMPRNVKTPSVETWMEKPVATNPEKSFVDINNTAIGLAIANRGLPEYEVIKENGQTTIALTLLRCVGYISRGDLMTRKGYAGWFLPTPGAQCLGKHTFHYSIIPHAGNWQEARVYQEAHNFNTPLRLIPTGIHRGRLPRELSFVQIKPDNLVLSAIKRAERTQKLIVRLYNSSADQIEGRLSSFFALSKAEVVKLNEEPEEELQVEDAHSVKFKVGPWEILTLALSSSTE